jgi:effector-binding domain-containing protein
MPECQIEQRPAQPYIGLPVSAPMDGLAGVIDRGFPELFGWLGAHGMTPAGAPFIRYLEVDMEGELKLELAVPVDGARPAGERVRAGVLPAGRYVTLLHVGPYDELIDANAALQRWAEERGLRWRKEDGSTWSGRVERYLTDPSAQPDPSAWETELAYLVEDGS